jgi:hypothetical protein
VTAPERAEDIFALLAQERAASPDLTIRESDVSVADGRVSHALDIDGRPAVLVPLAEGQPVPEDPGTRGVTIRNRELVDRGNRRAFLVVRSEEPALDPQFALFTDDLLSALAAQPESPAMACMTVLERWRNLMAAPPPPLLSRPSLAGLLAELHVLEAIAAKDPARAVDQWCGPEGARHDFVSEHGAIEVKATTGREGLKVQIHGILQMELPDHGPLTLYAEQLEEVHQGGDSVPDAIERVQQLGASQYGLRDRLEAIGFRSSDADIYRTVRFSVLRRAIALVDDRFPRIVRASFVDPSLPDRATDISYSIDVSDWAVPTDESTYTDRLVRALQGRR